MVPKDCHRTPFPSLLCQKVYKTCAFCLACYSKSLWYRRNRDMAAIPPNSGIIKIPLSLPVWHLFVYKYTLHQSNRQSKTNKQKLLARYQFATHRKFFKIARVYLLCMCYWCCCNSDDWTAQQPCHKMCPGGECLC